MDECLLSSKKMDWGTPQNFFDELDREFHFVGDMASNGKNAKCKRFYTEEDDALKQPWNIGGWVFCNPPYGRVLGKFVKKAYEEYLQGAKVVMLIPARTDTGYFHEYIYGKAEIRFLRGRLHFIGSDGKPGDPAPFPSMVVVYGREKEKRNCFNCKHYTTEARECRQPDLDYSLECYDHWLNMAPEGYCSNWTPKGEEEEDWMS